MFDNIIETIKEFLRAVFTKEMLQTVIEALQKIGEGIKLAIVYVQEFLMWLYGGIQEFFMRLFR